MFTDFDRDGADENWPAAAMDILNLTQRRAIFFAFGFINGVVRVGPCNRFVGRNDENAEFVDVEKLGGFGFGGARHSGQFVIESEIILNGNRRQSLSLAFDGDLFLGLHSLVQAIAPAAPGHQAAGVFVNDDDLIILDDVLNVFLVKGVSLEQLGDGMNALGLGLELLLQFCLGLKAFAGIGFGPDINLVQCRREIREHEGIRVFGAEEIAPLLGQVGFVAFFVDGKKQLLLFCVEFDFLLVGMKVQFGLIHEPHVLGIFQYAEQLLGFGLADLY